MKVVRSFVILCLFTAVAVHASLVRQKFNTDPALAGWQILGETNLFRWDSTNHNLAVTWDSSQPSSYFYHPLGKTYTQDDGFYVQFDLQVNDLAGAGYGMQLAVGLLHYADVTNANFSRANFASPNVCEFDWFPAYVDSGQLHPPSVEATMIDASAVDLFYDFDELVPVPGVTYTVAFIHQPGAGSITCQVSTNGQVLSSLPVVKSYNGPIGAFQLDMLSINCYQDDGYGDSLLAHGTVGNLAYASPLPVEQVKTPAAGQVQFASDTNWLYTLEQSTDFKTWSAAAAPIFGNGTNLTLQTTNPVSGHAYYRVRADLP